MQCLFHHVLLEFGCSKLFFLAGKVLSKLLISSDA